MKIGIVTEPLVCNYGGILQNYALQQKLMDLGHEPVTLDYLPSLPFYRYLLYVGKNVWRSFITAHWHTLNEYHHFLPRPEAIDSFVRNNITTSKKLERYTLKELQHIGVEALIVGSDQVWRKEYNPYIEDMFLAFASDFDCPKLAYAASFGVERWNSSPELTETCRTLISKFRAVSVRESNARAMCLEHLGCDAEIVLDPTLLLDAEDYNKLIPEASEKSRDYIAAYILDPSERKNRYVQSMSLRTGLPVRILTVDDKLGCSVEEWLSTIRDAKYVVTDSFHGSVFSILFEKQFVTFVNRARGADRFTTLFDALGLGARLIASSSEDILDDVAIDYAAAKEKLAELRKRSLVFLEKTLEG